MTHIPLSGRADLGHLPHPFPPGDTAVTVQAAAKGPWALVVIDVRAVALEEVDRLLGGLAPMDLAVRLHSGDSPSWLPVARAAGNEAADFLDRLAKRLGHRPTIWPHARDVISDPPSLLQFLRARPAWRFLVDPGAMLSGEMLPRAIEHLERYLEVFPGHPQAGPVVLGLPGTEGERTVPIGTPGTLPHLADLTVHRLLAASPEGNGVLWPSP